MKRYLKYIIKDEDAQATAEFALMMVIIFFLFFMIFQAAVTYMSTQYIRYAAFMGARTYAVHGKEVGRDVIKSYLGEKGERLSPFIRPDLTIVGAPSNNNNLVTFTIKYRALFYFPLLGEGRSTEQTPSTQVEPQNEFLGLTIVSEMKNENFNCAGRYFDNKTRAPGSNGSGC